MRCPLVLHNRRILVVAERHRKQWVNRFIAFCGALAPAAVGVGLCFAGQKVTGLFYLVHLAFLLPGFGDGKVLWSRFRV